MPTAVVRPRISSGVIDCRTVPRTTMLTVSDAPTPINITIDSHRFDDRPKTNVVNPYSVTAHSRIGPCLGNGPRSDRMELAITAPIDGAAYNNPRPCDPTRNTSVAKSGSSKVAEPKKVARK